MTTTHAFSVLAMFILSVTVRAQQILPADRQATKETVNLYRNLKHLAGRGFMFGHQDDLAYGVNWRFTAGRSDVKESAGDYPALYGWELGNLEKDSSSNLDGVPFSKIKQFILEGYERGAVITISWHAGNPLTGGNAWDTAQGTVASILPGGARHALYISWLDRLADFLLSLKGKRGELIPVLFRPYHELTGTWFWWCRNNCSPEEFRALWRQMAGYLRENRGVHNLIYVYNTADFGSAENYLERYPGDDLADVLSFDSYQYGDPQAGRRFIATCNAQLTILDSLSAKKGKPVAIAETGYEQVPDPAWWTKTLMPAIGDHRLAYVLVWRNHGYNAATKHMHYYAPYPGQVSAADFARFYGLRRTLFEKDVAKEKLYLERR